ncbi:HIRAN domain-containing protein [Duganella sp. S19_KUP01_CR8]|uniref:HIRAN domain-containing protein n=1 Tax=Duganella sp. S19_KUP01_CR8 TaxID=3025502 RepID=UPI002FCDA730
MNQIEHIIDPNRLLLVWRAGANAQCRTRRVVAEIVKSPDSDGLTLRYTKGTPDFENAKGEGFLGYPAFDLKQAEHTHNVLDSFIRRLPPRKRDDFPNYLSRHRLPIHQSISDLALLAYTNAKLPSDGFELYPDLTNARPPFELVFEVAGFRHQDVRSSEDIYIGDPIVLKSEPDNPHDGFAVAVYHSGAKIGYIDRAQSPAFSEWMRKGYSLNASVERINGKPERPLVYIYLTVR